MGINNAYLDHKKYTPVVEKGWQALVKAFYLNGKLGWVELVGTNPKKVDEHMTEVYGVGVFLLAGTETQKLMKKQFVVI